jgi:hypothetical protein
LKTKILTLFASIAVASLLFAATQSGAAQTYYGHDGSLDKYLSKSEVKKMKGKGDLWAYIVKACATDRHLAVAGIILKSDIDSRVLGVNKNIRMGDCSYYGAVMNAKDSKTLGADLIEKHEAVEKSQKLLNELPSMTKSQKQKAMYEYLQLQTMLGFM